jgi:hypothetical protein
MPLINCPECQKEISSLSEYCIGCGCPQSAYPAQEVKVPPEVIAEPVSLADEQAEDQVSEEPASEPIDRDATTSTGDGGPAFLPVSPEVPGRFRRCEGCETFYTPSSIDGDPTLCLECGGNQPDPYQPGVEAPLDPSPLPTKRQLKAAEAGVIPSQLEWEWERFKYGGWGQFRPTKVGEEIRLSRDTWLEYRHPLTKKKVVVPVQGRPDWLGLLPWLWHLVRWTPARLFVWLSWLALDTAVFGFLAEELFGRGYRGEVEDVGAFWFLRLTLMAIVGFAYVRNGSRWRVEYLESRGYEIVGGIVGGSGSGGGG